MPQLAAAGRDVVGSTRSESKAAQLWDLGARLGARPVVLDALDRDAVVESVGRAQPDAVVNELTALARPLVTERRLANGQPGIVGGRTDGRVVSVTALDIAEGRVQTVRSIVNPDKLRHLASRPTWPSSAVGIGASESRPAVEADAPFGTCPAL